MGAKVTSAADTMMMACEMCMKVCRERGVGRRACCRCNEAGTHVLFINSIHIRTVADEISGHLFLPLPCRSGGRVDFNACRQMS